MHHRIRNAILASLLAVAPAACLVEDEGDLEPLEDEDEEVIIIGETTTGFDQLGPDTSIVQTGLRTFTPTAMVVPGDPAIELYAVNSGGILRKTWRNNGWSCWRSHGNPVGIAPTTTSISETNQGWDAMLRPLHFSNAAGGTLGTVRRSVVLGARIIDGPGVVAHPDIDFPSGFPVPPPVVTPRTFTAIPNMNRWFSAQTSVFEGSDVHQVFGSRMVNGGWTNFDNTDSPLLRVKRTPAGGFTMVEMRPPNTGVIEQIVGPGSATRIRTASGDTTFVFTSENIANGFAAGDVRMASGNGDTFSYGASLGTPNQLVVGAPLAVGYAKTSSATTGRINVFVVARASASTSYELREKAADGAAFTATSAWGNWGSPPDITGRFYMTSSVVRWDGPTTSEGNLRIDLFGHSTSGKLLRFHWNGAWWSWDTPVTAPDGGELLTTSSAVVDTATSDKVSVFARSSTGRIYEYSYTDTSTASPTAATWTDHAKLQLCPLY